MKSVKLRKYKLNESDANDNLKNDYRKFTGEIGKIYHSLKGDKNKNITGCVDILHRASADFYGSSATNEDKRRIMEISNTIEHQLERLAHNIMFLKDRIVKHVLENEQLPDPDLFKINM